MLRVKNGFNWDNDNHIDIGRKHWTCEKVLNKSFKGKENKVMKEILRKYGEIDLIIKIMQFSIKPGRF